MANILIRAGSEGQTMAILAGLIGKLGLQIVRVTEQYELVMPSDEKPRGRRGASGEESTE